MNTEEVRRAYYDRRFMETKNGAGLVEEFDAWLKEEKAKAWDEGFDEAMDDIGASASMAEHGGSTNPYRV